MWKTREQVRATDVYERVSAVGQLPLNKQEAYGRLAHKLPILVRQAGLAQALAFVTAKQQDGGRLLDDLAGSLHQAGLLPAADANALTAATRQASLTDYQWLTRETQALLVWYKRYAKSVLGVEQGEEDRA